MPSILIEFDKNDQVTKSSLESLSQTNFYESSGFDGSAEIIACVVSVSSATIGAITKIIVEALRSRKHIKIKFKGIEVTGISEDSVSSILERIINNERK